MNKHIQVIYLHKGDVLKVLELAVIIGGAIVLSLGKSNTKDNKNNKQEKESLKKITYRKFDNMTTYEINQWLKDNGLFDLYGEYTRETKISRIVEKVARN
jgi:hypothetical protein